MSDPKLISPLLDHFVMGGAISDHDGVRCYPAMREESDDKYILKVISIPGSARQLDALLLSGAYPDAQAARNYFESLVNDVENEAQVLRHLAKLEGFLAYNDYQVVPTDDGVGFEVYLLGSYKRSLAKHFRQKPMTHLGAVNLGIDLCAAMTVCRQAGCLYIDLKPENIFITDEGRYCVGDLGFVPMSSLKYASVPDKYRSSYTAPEMADPFATLNTSLDIYAIGLILYQAYNNNTLPFEGNAPAEILPPPEYADYEMAEIILKACAPDPADRWSDPKELGQALDAYMQRNGANDPPIVPPSIIPVDEVEFPVDDAAFEDEPTEAELDYESGLVSDETAPSEDSDVDLENTTVSDELSDILAQAEELLAHEAPAPVVAPEAIEIPIPAPIVIDQVKQDEDDTFDSEDAMLPNIQVVDPSTVTEQTSVEVSEEDEEDAMPEKSGGALKAVFGWLLALVILAGVAFSGYYFYTNYYLQNIEKLTVDGKDTTMTVVIDSQIEDSLLTAYCTDTYGTVKNAPVENGQATFTGLNPGSQYTVHVEISGLHKLTGSTSGSYATPPESNILDFSAAIGTEDGSVQLSFTVMGQDTDSWSIAYSTDGEEERSISFSGHTTTITGLTVGKEYTFRLIPDTELYMIGTTEIQFVAPKLIMAENLTVTNFDGSNLQVSWDAPADVVVNKWIVRCYNDNGYDTSIEVQDCTATFANIDTTAPNTIEVTAEGMNQSARTFITANPLSITDIQVGNDEANVLSFQWDFQGNAPEGGWLLTYTIDNSDIEGVVQCSDHYANIHTVIPGATYQISIQAASGATLLGGNFTYMAPAAQGFAGYDVSWQNMEFSMCKTPEESDWDRFSLSDDDYTTTFAVGEKASFLARLLVEYNISYDEIVTLYLIRDEAGKIISADTQNRLWIDMWYRGYCELDVPSIPQTAGTYTVDIFFNGASVTTQTFTVE